MSKIFSVGSFDCSHPMKPYLIAEVGVNHEGSMELARRLVDEAAEGGAHAVKFQSYKAGKIASKFSPAYWDTSKEPTESQYKLFQKYDQFEPHDYAALADYCREKGVDFMSTPFDLDAVDFLDPLVTSFKIASADITNLPLLRKVARTGKPVILSTGASTLPEVELAVSQLRKFGAPGVALLHCVLNYPTPPERAQLGMIRTLARTFPDCAIGYSDHVVPDRTISALECAALLGACILEKHFTHDKSLPGNDHYHAMDKEDLKRFLGKLDTYRAMLGEGDDRNLELEAAAREHARRSVVASRSMKAGEVLTENDLIAKRPGHGISPIFWDELVGRTLSANVEEDELLQWKHLEQR